MRPKYTIKLLILLIIEHTMSSTLLSFLIASSVLNPTANNNNTHSFTDENNLSVVIPKQSNKVLTNPGIGFTELQRVVSNDPENPFYEGKPVISYPDTSTIYYRWYWDQLTTATDPNLNERMLEKKIDNVLEEAAAVNKKVVIRFMALRGKNDPIYDADVNKDSSGIPCWLVQELYGHGLNGSSCHLSDKEAVSMFKNPLFIHRMQQFLDALGKRYDNNKTLLRIDMGMVGTWGEWNLSGYAAKTSNSVGLVDNGYTLHNLEPYIAALVHAFPHTPKTMLGTDKGDFLSYATNRGFGWRVDCLGDWSKGWSEMEDGYPGLIAHASDIQTNTAPDVLFDQRWKKSAVDFEICQDSLQDWSNIKNPLHLTYDQVQQTFDFALKEHASLIDAKSHQIPNIYQPLLTAFLNKLGYRYQLNEVDYSRNIPKNGTLTINSQWQNLGVAPSYINYPVTWRLRTANGSIIAYHTSNAKIENWFPAADYEDQSPIYKVSDHFQLGNQISKGQYFLDVGLVEKGTYNAKVLLANDTKMTTDTGQSYTINNNVIKNNNSIVSYVDNNHYLYNGNVKYPSSFFFDKHSEQYIKQQNNIGRWNEIATINVI
ncbi:DUF4832 domain-containing protein [Photobacterium kishitanii]|uniref:DUF4832 domain-containing protein n=2 Tax=Photobacterium kishitanii TaxID=318456 RepID=A0AAX0YX34_9GAMM|nr:DUF4832 domain-containing protein [Photobacterium kishitanii]PSX26422.1 DUF4832 domain-containing protein [Photobacterium kishitanii]PSX30957.1 DUF4832 domain-containing protein [Photobacterium kishitanii]PSX45585.1 DUF4832 domain-containing protein [Photobacterium kishitanii]